jgi:phosphoenolpyruvate carboxykinase (ATP)
LNWKRNLPVAVLVEEAIVRKEARLTSVGSLAVTTGAFTGRSPKDRFFVREPSVEGKIHWGRENRGISGEHFDRLYRKMLDYAQGKELYVFDGYAGADPGYRLPVRVITEFAWHSLFAHQLLIRPAEGGEPAFEPGFTVYALPGVKADPATDGTRSETFIVISFEKKVVLIGGTEYAGEIKKSIFSVMNFLLPDRNVLPMHCSANVGERGDVALFFGLSGTGKTTLSADPDRKLIGDDEHVWTETGVFNIEGGCYAKTIHLTREKEPQIFDAIKFGAILENVVINDEDREADYDDESLTENTRAAYPVEHIENAVIPGVAGHPEAIVFLTADAFGVLPPIARLTRDQAMYYFLSGYTSKLAGTERGVTKPEAVFSACFNAPFMPRHPMVYADMLGRKIERNGARVYLVNTGWTGGPYGVGERIRLAYTRAMVSAALDGTIERGAFETDPHFGLAVPKEVAGVPNDLLMPRRAWKDPEAYDRAARELALRFRENFGAFGDAMPLGYRL